MRIGRFLFLFDIYPNIAIILKMALTRQSDDQCISKNGYLVRPASSGLRYLRRGEMPRRWGRGKHDPDCGRGMRMKEGWVLAGSPLYKKEFLLNYNELSISFML